MAVLAAGIVGGAIVAQMAGLQTLRCARVASHAWRSLGECGSREGDWQALEGGGPSNPEALEEFRHREHLW